MTDAPHPIAAFLERAWTRLVQGVRSRRFWFASVVFGIALVAGALVSAVWLHGRVKAPVAVAAGAQIADPTHPPLPTPMSGSLSSLQMPAARGPDAAYIADTPPPEPEVTPDDPVPDATATEPVDPDTAAASVVVADTPPQIVDRADPAYPTEALRAQDEGVVGLQIAVDTTGNVADVDVAKSSGSRTLDSAAVDAARQWHFRPATHQGHPVAAQVQVPVEFRLDER